jgi:hypothetical protein
MAPPREPPPGPRKTANERQQLLARAIAMHIAQGARVESQSDYDAVVVRGLRLQGNHGLRIDGGERRARLRVDECGNLALEKL